MADGYLDIHSHILPGIDDGSKSWEITKAMLMGAYEQGVRTIVATPHNYPGGEPQDNEKVRQLHARAEQMAQEIDSNFHVLLGNEIYFRESIQREIEEEHILTMADSNYLLVEFNPHEKYRTIYHGIKALIEVGYMPIIAHVERVNELFTSDEKLTELRKMGCYMQANVEDMVGGIFNRSAVRLRKLADRGMIHLLGSDCHNLDSRKPLMEDALKVIRKHISKESYEKIVFQNRDKFLAGKYM